MTSSLKPSKENIEKLIFIRHGEKPAKGLGLLTCKGMSYCFVVENKSNMLDQ